MNADNVVSQSKDKFQSAVEHFQSNLKSLRTGRASASMLDGVTIEAYGTSMPLNQAATVTAPEAQLIQVTPFDPGNIQAIASAIRNNPQLGMNPSDDGRVVRVPVPPLTEERRRDIVKQVGQKQEDCMIQLRSVRRDAMDAIDKAKKAKEIGEDEAKRLSSQVEEHLKMAAGQADAAAKAKEKEIMTV
ncbi:MAG TPA: ribosome recycling factor [Candidatus Saccharimonadales bacterium]|nr:ribosome recycling factor [Candidatus Saccharimonadales bacterium]